MIFLHLRSHPTLLAAIVALSLCASSHTIAQDTTCTLSGRVVDVEGNPIVGLSIEIQPFVIDDSELLRAFRLKKLMPEAYASPLKSQTDEAGRFSVTGIKPGPIQFVAHPPDLPDDGLQLPGFVPDDLFAPDAEVLSIEIGAITVYPPDDKHPPWGGITFGIEPGAHLENIEVTVEPRMRIRGRIVFSDGTPLANAQVTLNVRQRDFDGQGTYSLGGECETDDVGYFVEYVDESGPGFYTVAVEFQGFSAASELFMLEAGQRHDGLVLTFDSEPVPIAPVPDPDSDGPWIVNPVNGHNYKRVYCESWDDAQAKAIAENVHLVSINNAAEHTWLVRIFGTAPYWIGLTDLTKEGEWGWTSGEPLTYTSWASHKLINADRGEENYAFMGFSPDGRWHKVGPQSPEWRIPPMAILEKEDLPAKPLVEEK